MALARYLALAFLVTGWLTSTAPVGQLQAFAASGGIETFPSKLSKQCRKGRARFYDECSDQAGIFRQALDTANRQGKVLLVSFGAEWCIWCHVFYQYIHGGRSKFTYHAGSPEEPDLRRKVTLYEKEKRDVTGDAKALAAFVARNFVVVHIDGQFAPGGWEVLEATGAASPTMARASPSYSPSPQPENSPPTSNQTPWKPAATGSGTGTADMTARHSSPNCTECTGRPGGSESPTRVHSSLFSSLDHAVWSKLALWPQSSPTHSTNRAMYKIDPTRENAILEVVSGKSKWPDPPWKSARRMGSLYRRMCSDICHQLRLSSEIELDHYGQGYASFLDAWFYKEDRRYAVKATDKESRSYVGLWVLMNWKTPFYVMGEGEKSWGKSGASSYLPDAMMVDKFK